LSEPRRVQAETESVQVLLPPNGIAYAKIHDEWQLVVIEGTETQNHIDGMPVKDSYARDETEYGGKPRTPLLEAPLSLQVKALPTIEKLIAHMHRVLQDEVAIIEHARDLANTM
jgi:hypothetical protein